MVRCGCAAALRDWNDCVAVAAVVVIVVAGIRDCERRSPVRGHNSPLEEKIKMIFKR